MINLLKYLDLFLGSLISVIANIFIIVKLYKIKINNKKLIFILITTLAISIINIYNRDLFKVLLIIPILSINFKYILNIEIQKSLSYVIIATFYLFLGEVITGLIFSLLPFDYAFIYNNVLGGTIGSITVVLFTIPFIYIKVLSSFLIKILEKLNKNNILVLTFLFITAIGAFTYRNTHGIESKIALLVNIIIFFIFSVVSYLYFRQIHKTWKIKEEYNSLLNYLERYENELDKKRKIVHEFNNQLIVINGYASKNNKKLKNYLNEIIHDQKSISNDSLLNNIENLPKGFKGLIYYKLSQIEKDLKLTLYVEKSIKSISVSTSKRLKNTLKIIGILLDNAIEASLDSKEKTLDIKVINKDNFIEIIVENSFKSKFETSKIFNKGFTTKGNGRGYGLAIVKDILNDEPEIKLNFQVEKNFISILKVKKSQL